MKNGKDTDQLMQRCSSDLAKQRGGASSFISLSERHKIKETKKQSTEKWQEGNCKS